METSCDQLTRLSAHIGSVPGLLTFTAKIDQLADQLLLPGKLERDEVTQVKQLLAIVGGVIGSLRRATALQLRALGVEQENAG